MLKQQEFQTLTGKEYVMAAAACAHDKSFEKKSWNERIAHFHEIDWTSENSFKEASNPIGMRAAALAYDKATTKQPSGYTISLDASSSGLQLLSMLMSCPKSFSLCGGDENILDAYQAIYKSMDGDRIGRKLTKEQVKKTIMTAFYGSEKQPKDIFGENVDVFFETMEKEAPGAWDLNLGIQELWELIPDATYDWRMPDNFYCCIETQDSDKIYFNLYDKEYSTIQYKVGRPMFHKGLGPNLIHSVDALIAREMGRRCSYDRKTLTRVMGLIADKKTHGTGGKSSDMVQELWDHYQKSGFLSMRILDYLHHDTMGYVDADLILEKVSGFPHRPFDMMIVHDCFRAHANHGNDLRWQYNQILADINDSNLLKFMVGSLLEGTGSTAEVHKLGKIERGVILNANYTLC